MSKLRIVKLIGQGLNNTVITGGLVPRGAYDNSTDYLIGDAVDYTDGSSYVMFADAPAGTLPTNTTYWQILAEKGNPGSGPYPFVGTNEPPASTDGELWWDTDDTNGIAPGGAVDPQWGMVGGTLSDQTDLQDALDLKADSSDVTTALSAKEDVANKDTDGTLAANSDTNYPSQKAVKTYVDGHVPNTVTQVGIIQVIGAATSSDSNSILDTEPMTGSPLTPIGQPDVPRCIFLSSTAPAGMVVIDGNDYNGHSIGETIDMTGATTAQSLRAYSQVNSITTDNVMGETISVGVSEWLGIKQTLLGIPYAGGGIFRDAAFSDGIPNRTSITHDPDEVSLNTWHYESLPAPSDMILYLYLYDVFDHQFA